MITRRAVLAAAGGVVAGMGLPLTGLATTSASAAASTRTVPQTLARRVAGFGQDALIGESPFPLSHLAVAWSGPRPPGARIRSRSGWGDWRGLHNCRGGKDDATGGGSWALLTVPGAIGYEISNAGTSGAVDVTELNTVDGPARAFAPPPAKALTIESCTASLTYLSRASWGCDDSLRFNADGSLRFGPTQYFPVQTLTVHHTAGANDDPDPAATVRAIYYYDTITQGWGDMGYHLLIDEAGAVYEGRWSGDDPVPVFGPTPAADGRPQMVTAAHVAGFNSGNIGIVLLGDFTSRQPTPAARAALTDVLAVLSAVELLDPTGTTTYVNPISGISRTVDTISGHRDWAPTECPGNLFYPQLPAVRQDVANLLPQPIHRSAAGA